MLKIVHTIVILVMEVVESNNFKNLNDPKRNGERSHAAIAPITTAIFTFGGSKSIRHWKNMSFLFFVSEFS